ncbi:hypothetical protein V5738_11005 [Salinisphaera sp. SPP-AMP-43]|uniref:hypothetical protein n=1 Tax=Salinisphaera sp. SPP-AMP-43 TaxID=3121288 RepID=UPI003C6E7CE3
MSKRNATKAERDHMARVAELSCVLCTRLGQEQWSRTTVHHLREGQGGAQRADHFLTIALCEDCHQNSRLGLHGDRTLLRIANCDELDLLADTLRALSARWAA